jgi:hypothetical protein
VELVREQAARVDSFAAMTGTGGVAALQDKTGDEPVEDRVIVVAVVAELKEVARCEWRLLTPELELEVAEISFENDFGAVGGLAGKELERGKGETCLVCGSSA